MVVDLAVADEEEALFGRGEGLFAAVYVHDGEAPVAEGVPAQFDQAVVVRAAVGDASHHAPGGLLVHAAISANDSAHVSLPGLGFVVGNYVTPGRGGCHVTEVQRDGLPAAVFSAVCPMPREYRDG